MKALYIKATEYLPRVILNSEEMKFEISGQSRPDDARNFYKPILEWIDDYYFYCFSDENKKDEKTFINIFEFRFGYFDSTSAKYILDLIKKLEIFNKGNFNFKIKWHYDKQDIDMKEAGIEYAGMTTIPFEMIVNK